MFGIACVCTSLIALVASIARQARGSYTMAEKGKWTGLVLTMGSLAFVLGLILLLFTLRGEAINFVGFVQHRSGADLLEHFEQGILLAKIWHADFRWPTAFRSSSVLTALVACSLAAFLLRGGVFQAKYFVPRVCCRVSEPSASRSTPSSRSSKAARKIKEKAPDFWRRR